jgi:hypothetical protein
VSPKLVNVSIAMRSIGGTFAIYDPLAISDGVCLSRWSLQWLDEYQVLVLVVIITAA